MPIIKQTEFLAGLKKTPLAPAYLLAGEEGYFISRALDILVERALSGAPRDFNLDIFYGKDSRADAVAAQASTLPMMAERRVVILKEADKLRDLEPIKSYLESPSDSTVFILVAENADKSKEKALSTAVAKRGVAVHFYHPFESEIPRHIRAMAKAAGYDIDEAAARFLSDFLVGNLALIEAEVRKVFNYMGERKKITLEDVKESAGDFGLPLIFDLIDAAADKRRGVASEVLAKLLRDGEEPLMMLSMMAGHWRKLVSAREMKEGGAGDEEIAKALRLNFNNKKSFLRQVSALGMDEMTKAFRLFREADTALKSSAVSPGAVIEMLLFRLTEGGRA